MDERANVDGCTQVGKNLICLSSCAEGYENDVDALGDTTFTTTCNAKDRKIRKYSAKRRFKNRNAAIPDVPYQTFIATSPYCTRECRPNRLGWLCVRVGKRYRNLLSPHHDRAMPAQVVTLIMSSSMVFAS